MEEKDLIERKLENVQGVNIIEIENTPFQIYQENDKNYILCGKVRLETDCKIEEIEEKIKQLSPDIWKLISLAIQGHYHMLNNQKN